MIDNPKLRSANRAVHKSPRTQLATDLIATSARIHRLREQLRRAEALRESQLAEMCQRHEIDAGGTGFQPVIAASAANDPADESHAEPQSRGEDEDRCLKDWPKITGVRCSCADLQETPHVCRVHGPSTDHLPPTSSPYPAGHADNDPDGLS